MIKKKDIKSFKKAVKRLNDVIERINKYNPKALAYMYVDYPVTMFLLDEVIYGDVKNYTHASEEDILRQYVKASVETPAIDCGDLDLR